MPFGPSPSKLLCEIPYPVYGLFLFVLKSAFLEFHYFYDPFIVLYKYQLMIFFYFLLILQDFNYNHLREFSNHRHKAISFVTFIINYKLNLTKNYLKEKLTN